MLKPRITPINTDGSIDKYLRSFVISDWVISDNQFASVVKTLGSIFAAFAIFV